MDADPRGTWLGCVLLAVAFLLGSGVSLALWVLFIRWAATCA